jgi:dCMP deaminase
MRKRPTDIRFLRRAREVSTWSKDPGTKIGAIAVDEDGVTLTDGCNGFPRGFADTADRLNDRPFKLKHTIHAEQNCIYNASRTGAKLKGSTMYVYGLPVCENCSLGIIQAGVRSVVMCYPEPVREEWKQSHEEAHKNFTECGVGVFFYPERELDL